MSKLQGLLFALATVVLVAVSTYYFVARDWLPELHSDRGAIDVAMWWSLLVTGIVFIATNLLLAYFTWRYSDTPGAKAAYWHDSPKLEISWTAVTAAILLVFLFNALNLWGSLIDPKTIPADAVTIEVTAQQFAWNFRYPGQDGQFGKTDVKLADPEMGNFLGTDTKDPATADDIVTPQGVLVVPEGRTVLLKIRSLDVIHSFFLPNFRVKQDAMPGLTIQTWFKPTKAGKYEIACAEHCGLGHYRMKGTMFVLAADAFQAAMASQEAFDAASGPLTQPTQ